MLLLRIKITFLYGADHAYHLDIPENILAEAMRISGVKTKTGTIIISLREFINRNKVEQLRALRGKVDLDIKLDELRRNRVTQ
ncbi:MAG: type II toxin-antitoxin system VapB family antitoxin [Desulfurivibrio sp.]